MMTQKCEEVFNEKKIQNIYIEYKICRIFCQKSKLNETFAHTAYEQITIDIIWIVSEIFKLFYLPVAAVFFMKYFFMFVWSYHPGETLLFNCDQL